MLLPRRSDCSTRGNGRHNHFFRERYGIHRLMLLSAHFAFDHPVSGSRMAWNAEPGPAWQRLAAAFGWTL